MNITKIIMLPYDAAVLLGDEDVWVFSCLSWHISTKGYVETGFYFGDGTRKTVKLHHFIVGTPINNLQVDHIDGNKLNNTKSNLRIVTNRENRLNTDYVRNASGIKQTRNGKWEARITIEGVYHHIGTFPTIEDAKNARQHYQNNHGAI